VRLRISATRGRVHGIKGVQVATRFTSSSEVSTYSRPASQLRLIQHKQEAYWFYRFLSIVYDHIVNPGHWTKDMRDDALIPARLTGNMKVCLGIEMLAYSSSTVRYLFRKRNQGNTEVHGLGEPISACAHRVKWL
jgi:hypothetical protein